MPGVCPNCIKLVPEGDSCPDCQGPLIPASEWASEREQFLASRPRPDEAYRRAAALGSRTEPAAPGRASDPDRPSHFGWRFFLGAVAGIGAMIATLVAVFKIRGG
jgi:hypothetical protein